MAKDVDRDTIICDLCARPADPHSEDCVDISCSYRDRGCDARIYHRACVEKYQKASRATERNQKHCFMCPRGKGKVPGVTCKGKVQNVHACKDPKAQAGAAAAAPAPAQARPGSGRAQGGSAQAAPQGQKQNKRPALAAAGARLAQRAAPPMQQQRRVPLAQQLGPLGSNFAGDAETGASLNDSASETSSMPVAQELPVGFTLAPTKAQLKNMKRREKKKVEGSCADCAAGSVVAAGRPGSGGSSESGVAGGLTGTSAAPGTSSAAEQLLNANAFVNNLADYNRMLRQYGLAVSEGRSDHGGDSGEEEEEQDDEEEGGAAAALAAGPAAGPQTPRTMPAGCVGHIQGSPAHTSPTAAARPAQLGAPPAPHQLPGLLAAPVAAAAAAAGAAPTDATRTLAALLGVNGSAPAAPPSLQAAQRQAALGSAAGVVPSSALTAQHTAHAAPGVPAAWPVQAGRPHAGPVASLLPSSLPATPQQVLQSLQPHQWWAPPALQQPASGQLQQADEQATDSDDDLEEIFRLCTAK